MIPAGIAGSRSDMDRTELKQRIDRLEALPTLPAVVVHLLELTSSEEADVAAIARVIESDQALTARLLRLVNSSLFSFRTEITTVQRAVASLGTGAVRCIALGMGVARLFPELSGETGFDACAFWKRSLASAVCTRMIAEASCVKADRNEAFVAGLLHDIGQAILVTLDHTLYGRVIEEARAEGCGVMAAEEALFGATHCESGKWLSERWGLPDMFTTVIWLHHQPVGVIPETDPFKPLIFMVHTADLLVDQMLVDVHTDHGYEEIPESLLAAIGVTQESIDGIRRTLLKKVEEFSPMLDLEFREEDAWFDSMRRANMELSRMNLKTREQMLARGRREKRFRALHEMNARLLPGQNREDVIRILAEVLRRGFEVARGICSVFDDTGESLTGLWWEKDGPLRELELPLDENAAEDALPGPDTTSAILLSEAALRWRQDKGLSGSTREVVQRHDVLVAPMVADRRCLGQILADFREETPGPRIDEGIDEFMAFAAAAALALSRTALNSALRKRSEDLACAILRQEETHKQLLHSERLAAVGKMAAGAAHEVNNPLAIISGRAQMMLQKAQDPENQKPLNIIIDQAARASKILNDLMRFARPAVPEKELTDAGEMLREVVEMFEHKLTSHQITLTCDVMPGLPRVMADRKQLQQVLVNLFINAEHAITPPGAVTVRARLDKSGTKVQIQVADTGCGIPPDKQQKIFEPFFTTREEGQGTGLGLSLAHGIIRGHKGAISVQSEVGKGTMFTISLPVAEEMGGIEEASAPEESAAGEGLRHVPRMLVVDDEVHVRALISEALIEAGYEVEQANNGLAALQILRQTPVDLITLDIRMPRMDGMSVLRAVRQRQPGLPVVVITGLAQEDEIATARELGISAFIRKPFEMNELLDEIRKALHARRPAPATP
jgi:signal transduction histidine kinase/HD-like signal output (HDOD) protein/ActR/RegA family two-component response regulator